MTLVVGRLASQVVDDTELIERLVNLINQAYAVAEEGLWLTGAERTNPEQTSSAIAAGQVLVAHLDGVLAGTVQTREGRQEYSFGTLAVASSTSRRGIASALVRRVETDAAATGAKLVRLEVLVAEPPIPHLQRLASWYSRLGYRETGRTDLHRISPHEAPFLARACAVSVMEKTLPV